MFSATKPAWINLKTTIRGFLTLYNFFTSFFPAKTPEYRPDGIYHEFCLKMNIYHKDVYLFHAKKAKFVGQILIRQIIARYKNENLIIINQLPW
jgi:hypothetical protein